MAEARQIDVKDTDHDSETASEPQLSSVDSSVPDCDNPVPSIDDSSQGSQNEGHPCLNTANSIEDMDTSRQVNADEDRQHRSPTALIDDLQIADNNEDDVQMVDQHMEQEVPASDKVVVPHQDLGHRHSTIPDDADIVDLTLDGIDDENDSVSQHPRQYLSADRPIKLEPPDTDDHSTANFELPMDNGPTAGSHILPNMGDTANHNNFDDMLSEVFDDTGNEMNSESMARMLQQFNQNNDEAPPPPEIDSDEEDTRARRDFEKEKNNFLRRQRAGRTTAIDEINFKRHVRVEESRLRARQTRKEHERDETMQETGDSYLFVRPSSGSPSPDFYDGLLTADPEQIIQEEEVTVAKKNRRGRQPKAKGSGPKGISKKHASVPTTAKRRNKKNQPATVNPYNLLQHNVIAAAKANQGLAAQPGFSSKNKKDALSELIASLPADERNLYVSEKVDLDKATKKFAGRGSMKADGDGNWRLKGMKTSLRHYQLLGAGWMRDRENDASRPRGGIIGDDMGLGKTVLAIANMVDGRLAFDKRGARATLIIVPASLLSQWMSEFEKHVEPQVFKNVASYRSKHKILDPVNYLASHDIIVTTYSEVARSLPPNNPPPSLCTTKAKDEWWEKEVAEKKGPLHKISWHRIILDEAQAIKNYLSKTSQAVCKLTAKYKWCLSGTPIQNTLDEFYPYFRFLNCPDTGSFDLFKRNFTKNGSDKAIQRLQVVLNKIMLRRTHETKLFGRPILTMPPIEQVTIEVRFNIVERAIYNIIKERFFKRAKALATKTPGENSYRQIFVLILRLRQLVGHPLLIQKTLEDLVEIEDIERLSSLLKAPKVALTEGEEETAEALQTALTISQNKRANRKPEADEQQRAVFQRYMKSLTTGGNWNKINERSLCNACGSPASQPHITNCLHLYCLSCLNDLCYADLRQGHRAGTCFTCGVTIDHKRAVPFHALNGAGGRQSPDEDIDWYQIPGLILRSAKVKAAANKIREWFSQDPKSKVIIFTQFRGMIKIMERVCHEEKSWGYATYYGEMSFDARDEQIELFSNSDSCRILIAAMKAGGVGLNLQAANRVIIMDLWWNESVESQAYTRCFRYGQERDVEVARIVVEDSIDTQIIKMQERKKQEIAKAMDEHRRPKNLTTQELLELFAGSETGQEKDDEEVDSGETGADEPFIFPNDPYDQDGNDSDVELIGSN